MRAFRILIPLYLGFLLSSILAFMLGHGGLYDYYKMSKIRDALRENITELTEINEQLNQRLTLLSSDPETVRREAQAMGYYQQGEKRILIEGYSEQTEYFPIGKLIQFRSQRERKSIIFRLLGFSIPLGYYIYAFARRLFKKNRSNGSIS